MRFHFISALAGILLMSSHAYGVNLNGCVVRSDDNATDRYGMYTFDTSDPLSLRALPGGSGVSAKGGGTLAGEEYYAIDADRGILNVYDPETWKAHRSFSNVMPALDMTYDSSDGMTYCIFVDQVSYLGVLDATKGTHSLIGEIGQPVVVIMSDGKGKLYGIGMEGNLYSISKSDGSATLIGSTGVTLFLSQSATVDTQTGKCYWAAAREDYSTGLYEVSLTDGSATLLYNFPNNEEITGLYVAPELPAGTPERASGIAAAFDRGSLDGTLGFVMPAKTVSGSALTGSLGWTVLVDGSKTAEGSAQPSEKVSTPLTVERGRHVFTVVTSAGDVRGLRGATEAWTGNDNPVAPDSVWLRKESAGKAVLTWKLPQGGVNGGYVDASALHSMVTRHPDGKVFDIAPGKTELTDEIDAARQTAYSYTVYAEANGEKSESVSSRSVTMGPAGEVPYILDFNSAEQNALLMTENNDVSRWITDKGKATLGSLADALVDGWLFFSGLALKADDNYRLSFGTEGSGMTVEACYGILPSSADMTDEIIAAKPVSGAEKHSATFHVAADGEYYIGIHASGYPSAVTVSFNNVRLERTGSSAAPAAPELSASAYPSGALGADISISVPSRTIKGDVIEESVTVTLMRDGETIRVFENAAAGSVLTYSDTAAGQGFNVYEAYASNGNGDGEHSTAKVYAGPDVPAAPSGVRVEETEEGKLNISWEAPSTGANGGYINSSALTYIVERNGWKEVARGAGLSATDFIEESSETQLLAVYTVKAVSDRGEGPASIPQAIIAGKPYQLPYSESFAGGRASTYTWASLPTDNENVWMPWSDSTDGIPSYDGDGGLAATINFMHTREHMELVSPKFSVRGAVNPVLEFYVASTPSAASLAVDILADGTSRHHVSDIVLADGINEWRRVAVPLAEYSGARWIQLSLSVSDLEYESRVFVDAVSAYDDIDINLCSGALSVPLSMTAGVASNVTAQVRNVGKKDVDGYTVALYEGDRMVASAEGGSIRVGDTAEVALEYTPLAGSAPETRIHAVVECEGDLNTSDNVSAEVAVPVDILPLPGVSGLAAAYDGSVRLSWTAPDLGDGGYGQVTESFEDMTPFTTTDFGEWTAVEGDPTHEYNMEFKDANGNFIVFPGDYAWMNYSFTVVDLLQIPQATPEIGWSAVSGNRFIMTAYSSPSGSDTYYGDYIVSPRLQGCEQDITIHAKSLNYLEDGLESMWIMYSKGTADFEDFDILTEIAAVPDKWTRYTFSLPEGTQYFAIFSYQTKTALFLDDISYIPAGSEKTEYDLKGYNVYRDGILINDVPVADTAYADATADAGNTFSYSVSAVYTAGESALCEPVGVSTTGTEGPKAESFRVTAAAGTLIVEDTAMRPVAVYTADGRLAAESAGAATVRFSLPAGLYIVRAGGTAVKAVVR